MDAIYVSTLYFQKWMDSEEYSKICDNLEIMDSRKGHYYLVKQANTDTLLSAIIYCPGCGQPHSLSPGHLIHNAEKDISVTPSIHNKSCCGWHGYLTNGRFV